MREADAGIDQHDTAGRPRVAQFPDGAAARTDTEDFLGTCPLMVREDIHVLSDPIDHRRV